MIKLYYSNSHRAILNITCLCLTEESCLDFQRYLYIYISMYIHRYIYIWHMYVYMYAFMYMYMHVQDNVYTYLSIYLQIDQPHCKHSNEARTDFNTWNLQLHEILSLKKLLLCTEPHTGDILHPYFPWLIDNPCQYNSPLTQRHGYVLLLLFSLSYSYSPRQNSLVCLFPDLAFWQPCEWWRREVQLRVECLVLTDVHWGLVTDCSSVFWKRCYE